MLLSNHSSLLQFQDSIYDPALVCWHIRSSFISILFRMCKTLLFRQNQVAGAERKRNQRHGQANAGNAQQPLRMLVSSYHGITIWSPNWVSSTECERILICLSCHCGVTESTV